MPIGTVATFKKDQGFGFISIDGSDEQIFAHQQDIVEINGKDARDLFRHLNKGEEVSFETVQGDKGLKAINIKVLNRSSRQYKPQQNNRQFSKNGGGNRNNQSTDQKIERLLEVLSDETAEGGALITRSEVDYIMNGGMARV